MDITWADIGRILIESAVLVAFIKYLALPAVVERFKASLNREFESFRQELGLAKVTFDQHLTLLLDYYNRLYQHYRLCQTAASYDLIVHPAKGERDPKRDYLEGIDRFKSEWDANEGKVRLLLPKPLFDSHLAALSAINDFTQACKDYSPEDESTKAGVEQAFKPVDEAVQRLESGLRCFLRTEKLLA